MVWLIMNDANKSKAQLIAELTQLRQQVAALETLKIAGEHTQTALRESEGRFRSLIEATPDAIALVTLDGRYILANQENALLHGFATVEELLHCGQIACDFIATEDRDRVRQYVQEADRKRVRKNTSVTLLRQDGSRFPAEVGVATICDATGQPVAFAVVIRDITERQLTEAALRESEARFRQLVEILPDAVAVAELEGRLLLVNQQQAQQHGFASVEEMLNSVKNSLDLIAPEDVSKVLADSQRILREGIVRNMQHKYLRVDGSTFPGETSAALLRDDAGNPTAFVTVGRDITERNRIEEVLKRSEREKTAILDSITETLSYRDPEMRTVWMNRAAELESGRSTEQMAGKLCYEERYHRAEPCENCPVPQALHTGEIREGEVNTPDGKIWFVRGYPIKNGRGELEGVVEVSLEITARKQAELALRQSQEHLRASEERYRLISEVTSDYAFADRVEPDGSWVTEWITDAATRITGLTPAEIHSPAAWDRLIHPEDAVIVYHSWRKALAGQSDTVEYRILTPDRGVRWLRGMVRPIWDEQKQRVTCIYGAAQDITERKQAEAALRESEERYRLIAEVTSDYAFANRVEPDGTNVMEWITDAALRLTNLTLAEKSSLEAWEKLVHPEDWPIISASRKKVQSGQTDTVEFRIVTPDGQVRWMRRMARPVWNEQEQRITRIYGGVQDITERKQAEAALRESEERYRRISEAISDYAFSDRIEPDGTFVNEWVTDSALRIIGLSAEEWRSMAAWRRVIHPDDDAMLWQHRAKVLSGQPDTTEYRIIRPNGEIRWVRRTMHPIWDDQQNRVVRVYGAGQDITDQKQAENRALELKLERERMRLLAEFIRDASHEFLTPLSSINMNTHQLRRDTPQAEKRVQAIEAAVLGITQLVKDLEMMARLDIQITVDQQRLNWCELVDYAQTAAQSAANAAQLRLTLETDSAGRLPIQGNQEFLLLALGKIIQNAIRYTPPGGVITVRAGQQDGQVWAEIQDTGVGMDEETLAQIFKRFYRGDAAHTTRGFGLGLPIAQSVIEKHGGRIEVESQVGRGSLFRIWLPGCLE